MALAVTYAEGWVTTGPASGDWAQRDAVDQWWRGVAERAERFSEAEAAAGGSPDEAGTGPRAPLDRYLTLDASGPAALSSVEFLTEQVGRAADLGFTDVIVHWPRPEPPYSADLGVLESYLASAQG